MNAQGPKDVMDAAMLVLSTPRTRATAFELAQAYRTEDRFRPWLEDTRLARDAKAIQAAEARAARPAPQAQRRGGSR